MVNSLLLSPHREARQALLDLFDAIKQLAEKIGLLSV
jgi:hypothetical protein